MQTPEQSDANTVSKGTLIAGLIAAITASACCLGPLLLLTLGISGSWISNLTAMAPYRPVFIGITLLFLGLAFRKLYLTPQSCATDKPCAKPARLHKQRILFWFVTAMVTAMVAFPWYAPLFLE
ncbi:MAG TPA: mercury transporter MerT [Candidatus Tenderia electrophaga]|uniref:Mercuric transport protein MerT n=1 Tax=Candidatus Tenderia electrophaga TaxID=1748243 RepID=A0A832N4T5_9GAMM|nr:mercury transporter MerT [Candidatus Tenderia electrophaga]